MTFTFWFIFVGVLLTLLALAGSFLNRLPLSVTLLCLGAGMLAGPAGFELLRFDPLGEEGAPVLERLAEIAVIVSLFAAGLKMRLPIGDHRWRLPLRLAATSMVVTIALITGLGVFLLDLPLGGAILLGAVLAPTDPVLASDVQVTAPEDQDSLRFALTGEAGLNDGLAFPFVVLGLGLIGLEYDLDLHPLGPYGLRWFLIDLVWAIPGGLAIGALLGTLAGRLVVYLRRVHKEAVGLDDFLALGLISLSYGIALLANTWGFLAVFAAGLALRQVERKYSDENGLPSPRIAAAAQVGEEAEIATHPLKAHTYMASAVLGFTDQLERIAAVVIVVAIGSLLLTYSDWTLNALWFVPAVLLIVRPLSVWIATLGNSSDPVQKMLMGWFGIRGIGSVYYLMYAENQGLPDGLAWPILAMTLATIATSCVVHGMSVTHIMNWYQRRQ